MPEAKIIIYERDYINNEWVPSEEIWFENKRRAWDEYQTRFNDFNEEWYTTEGVPLNSHTTVLLQNHEPYMRMTYIEIEMV